MSFPREIFYNVEDERIIDIIQGLAREKFIPERLRASAYYDGALPIGKGQTISQPSLVAFMTDLLKLKEDDRVLEIGTGSGYQTAILAKLAKDIYTIEIIESLYEDARERLEKLGFTNINFKLGSGYEGWEDKAPFDKILLTAAPPKIPKALLDQLASGGRLLAPVGERGETQVLKLVSKDKGEIIERDISYVRFVPMVE